MKKILNIILTVPLILLGYGCTDLEEDLQGDFTETFTPSNPGLGATNNVNKATPADGLAAAFSRLFNGTANHGSYFSISEVSTDEVVITQKGGDWFDGGIWLDMHKHTWNSTNPGFLGAYNDTYGGIAQCNILLRDIEADNKGGRAQLRTLRAYYYWRLLDAFGNVKISTTPGVDVPQSNRAAVYNFIETELLAAIPDLSESLQGYGRVNKSGAYALLARLYLNAEIYSGTPQWAKAIVAADMVINSGIYDLSDSYAAVFAPDNVENVEHIWVVPFDESTGQNMNFAQMTLHYPSQLTFRFQEQPWNGYSTLEEFYNSYQDGDVRKENNFIVGPQVDLNGEPILDLAFDPSDQDGAPVNYTPAINELAPGGGRQAGARLGKFSFKLGQLPNMDNDFPLFRYGEILLTKAEASARLTGNWNNADALMLVNMLRIRAEVTTFTTMTAETFLAERGREMFQESSRRTDLIRFGAWGNPWWEKAEHPDFNHLILFPIPNDQIQAAAAETNKLTQNPGY